MTPEETRILALAQSVSLARTSRYVDVEDDELDELIDQTIDWTNQFIQELEMEADWNYVRDNDHQMSDGLALDQTHILMPPEVQRLVISPDRDLTIRQDGTVVATYRLVSPNQITNPSNPDPSDRATVVGNHIILSRPINETEVNGELYADSVLHIPRLSRIDVSMLDLVQPQQLIILGVAKNWSLADIVQGGISPSLTQKYNDLLQKAVAKNNETSEAYQALGEDFSYIGGIW